MHNGLKIKSIEFRQTPQRKAIIRYLYDTKNHPTAKVIFNSLKERFSSLSLSTVYQNLSFLTNKGAIKEISIKNMPNRYDFNINNHYHIICRSCGEVKNFDYPVFNEIEEIAGNIFNYKVHSHSLEIYGECGKCI